ncbi:EKC/KEOPS complex subunit TPRKB isoform X2 [Hippocampus comes]|uniref:EKC/KEOPS complex subunit TPRKB isoform X2 n=1 Tax=Hippocampus comes TaxID=109280 RepID=UPI00094F2ABF|nr:PREDICTED: EKC/KEOPS complex subunit TPRKB isoform X2 [Hippocampus comes]
MHLSQTLELFPDLTVTQILFKEVQNAAELRQNAVEGIIKGALIKANMLISEAFKRFGISDGDNSVLVVLVHNKEESQLMSDILTKVDGVQIPVDDLSSISDLEKIKKLYKVSPREEKCGTLLDAVVCRMATKDVM